MTSTTIFSDVVLPAATWYEKHDLNTTDMHPFIHSFNPAIAPPWQTRTDFDIFHDASPRRSAELAATHLGVRKDLVAAPLLHDTPDEMATPHGRGRATGRPASATRCPGVTMPKLVVVERDYGAVAAKMAALGPLLDTLGATDQGRHLRRRTRRSSYLRRKNGAVRGGVADGRPSLARDVARVRGDPRAVRHHQRPPGHRRASETLEERTGDAAGRPRRRARGQADHLRRHPGPARTR